MSQEPGTNVDRKDKRRTAHAQRKATVRDVARAAGLSVASVSRALSGARPVRPDVARRVAEAAEALGYTPDPVARALSNGSTASIGLVVPDMMNPFFPALADAVERSLRSAGLSMLLMNAENDPKWEKRCISELISRRVDGLLVSATHRTSSREAIEEAAEIVPVVQIDRFASPNVHRVVTDPVTTVRLCVDHMASRGCSTFAFVGANSSASPALARKRAFERLIKTLHPAVPARVLTGDFSVNWGYAAAKVVAGGWPEVDAIVCANDLIALGMLQGFLDLGRDVPRELAVTGCDDTFISGVSRPSITSVAQPVTEMAHTAIDLLARHRSETSPQLIELEPLLRVRGSTDRKPAAGLGANGRDLDSSAKDVVNERIRVKTPPNRQQRRASTAPPT
jgi:LacI family transcriptional regulator